MIEDIEPHKAFLRELRSTDGKARLILQLLGDGYFGDDIPQAVLARLSDLQLDFAIECFAGVQTDDGMKNIQVIDGALNCTFSIFQATEEEFALLFPEPRQDIQYAEDLALLPRQEQVEATLGRIWQRPIRKQDALGIHGTLFCGLERYKTYYRAKREDAVEGSAVNQVQRRLFGID